MRFVKAVAQSFDAIVRAWFSSSCFLLFWAQTLSSSCHSSSMYYFSITEVNRSCWISKVTFPWNPSADC